MKYTFDVSSLCGPLTVKLLLDEEIKVKSVSDINGHTTIEIVHDDGADFSNLRSKLKEHKISFVLLEWHKKNMSFTRVQLDPSAKVPKLFNCATKDGGVYTFQTQELGYCWNVRHAILSIKSKYLSIEETSS